ncbi:MAG TPA: hypothetical protein VNL15_06450 [Dehalococcoidia bacterium]|nr:hypothetical protein [Dehalococcoidia bacterium]
MALSLRIDPWAAEYEGALQIEEAEAVPPVAVDPTVETADWSPVEPEYVPCPETVVFIDGVQRTEVRVIGEEEGRLVYGAFASIGVGAAISRNGGSTVEPVPVRRIIALGDGAYCEPWEIECGLSTLVFEAEPTVDKGVDAWRKAVDRARREKEKSLGQAMVKAGHPLVIVDGRLDFQPTRRSLAVGVAKSIRTVYLERPYSKVLTELSPATRTPIFLIQYHDPVYSWYVRLALPRAIDHPLAGIVQVETLAGIGPEAALRLADITALHLPRFASSREWDPRAPQNLYPIGALERQLRHLLGDREWIRRHIEAHFYRRTGGKDD